MNLFLLLIRNFTVDFLSISTYIFYNKSFYYVITNMLDIKQKKIHGAFTFQPHLDPILPSRCKIFVIDPKLPFSNALLIKKAPFFAYKKTVFLLLSAFSMTRQIQANKFSYSSFPNKYWRIEKHKLSEEYFHFGNPTYKYIHSYRGHTSEKSFRHSQGKSKEKWAKYIFLILLS